MTVGVNYLGQMGQLGNQMFQYAAVLGISRYLGVPFTVPKHDTVVDDGLGNKLRIELFDCFDIKPDNIGYLLSENVFKEQGFEFDSRYRTLDRRENFTICGFFQSEKYFENNIEEVREQFKFKDSIIKDTQYVVEEFYDNPIGLHIRRGDFLINSGNHHNLTLEYYQRALTHFKYTRNVIVFSDDPEWCKEQSIFSDDRFIISEGNSSFHDLYLMSKCNDFIIANSTFSWWGAWLSDNPDKKVIAPRKWFGPNNAHLNTKDLYPNGWVIV